MAEELRAMNGSGTKRTNDEGAVKKRSRACIYRPSRTLGVIAGPVPFSCARLGTSNFIAVSVGKAFQVYDAQTLRLVFMSPPMSNKVRCLHNFGECVLVASGLSLQIWYRMTPLANLVGHRQKIDVLAVIGTVYLVSASATETLVWELPPLQRTSAAAADLEPTAALEVQDVVAGCHPPTYLNKIVLGTRNGLVELWNVKTKKRKHRYQSAPEERLTCMQASNALDIVAIGYETGRIIMLNVAADEIVFNLSQAQGAVTSLTFRTVENAPPLLVSGSQSGHFVGWFLEKREVAHVIEAHSDAVLAGEFLAGEPVLVTLGADNAVACWIYDSADDRPRYLKGRRGPPGPVGHLMFVDDNMMLVAGSDRTTSGFVGQCSFIQQQQNQIFSQGCLQKVSGGKTWKRLHMSRLPPVVSIACAPSRKYDWPNVVTAHAGLPHAAVWSMSTKSLAPVLLSPPKEESACSCVAVSGCGNYAVVGLENGEVHHFNLQSGMHRAVFEYKFAGPVCSLSCRDDEVIAAGTALSDARLQVSSLHSHKAIGHVDLRPFRESVQLFRRAGMLAAVALGRTVVVADVHLRKVVRAFPFTYPVLDIAFAPDGRWVAASTSDATLRIIDIPSAQVVEHVRFRAPIAACAFHPNGAFLLTAHTHAPGAHPGALFAWANKFLFDSSFTRPILRDSEPVDIEDHEGDADGAQNGPDEEAS
jgi:U3 small nucleolar RNA-associated protein 21